MLYAYLKGLVGDLRRHIYIKCEGEIFKQNSTESYIAEICRKHVIIDAELLPVSEERYAKN